MEFNQLPAKSETQKKIQGFLNIILLIALSWFMVESFFTRIVIIGHSMEPSLSDGDVVFVDTLQYKFFSPGRMDLVVFKRSDLSENVKRVIGLPGETLVIQNGHIYINGTILTDSRISNVALAGIAGNPVELGPDEFFLLGDNSDSSEDSRFQNVGNVRKEQISGKLWIRIAPFNRFRLL